jgi:hypothetical protein
LFVLEIRVWTVRVLGITADPFTGNRYTFGAGNPITNIELDGHRVLLDPSANCGSYCRADYMAANGEGLWTPEAAAYYTNRADHGFYADFRGDLDRGPLVPAVWPVLP